MLTFAFYVLSATVLAGVVLAMLHLRATLPAQRAPWVSGAVHGVGGAIGLALLLIALRDPPRGALHGTASFGIRAAVFLSAAVVTGIGINVLARRDGRAISLMMVMHGLLAATGYVLLAAYVSLG